MIKRLKNGKEYKMFSKNNIKTALLLIAFYYIYNALTIKRYVTLKQII